MRRFVFALAATFSLVTHAQDHPAAPAASPAAADKTEKRDGPKKEEKNKAPKPTPEMLLKGKQIFDATCLSCHGEKGDGKGPAGMYMNPPPRNFSTDPFKQGSKPEEIFATVTGGVAGTTMVAFPQLAQEDRWAVSFHVQHFLPGKEGKRMQGLRDKAQKGAAKAAAGKAEP